MTEAEDRFMFGGNHEITIQRDGEKCVLCDITRQEHQEKYGRDITVDHIDGRGCNTAKGEKNNSLDNLRTLCMHCHGVEDSKRLPHRKLDANKVVNIRHCMNSGYKLREIAEPFGVSQMTISHIWNNKRWKETY